MTARGAGLPAGALRAASGGVVGTSSITMSAVEKREREASKGAAGIPRQQRSAVDATF